ncbi:hypothetical protein FRX31_008818 [Thalictrum thalictroides]|uniref:F-box domain-containing protein n=1 Tax=Thalictrum thalictroides TaxID=46969 RepID=A0A7J6WYQ0_THATH|nr:hypothetical protein FRX31_008818 [Thalictrum thalictroides]
MMMPEDLVFQILLWLLVLSLLRFESVCKCWFAIIESSKFVTQHHHHLQLEEQNLLVVSHNWQIPSVGISFLSSSGSGKIFQVWENLDIRPSPLFDNAMNYGLKLITSCNGLISAETS